jgi:hypothetical protein
MHAHATHRRLFAGSLVLAAGLAACSDTSIDANPVAPAITVLSAGTGVDAQTGTVGQPLATPISVRATDPSGAPISGVVVSWTVRSGGGAVDNATSTTDADGNVVVHWTLGTVAGADSLLGTTSNGATSIIAATALADAPASIAEVSGDQQNVSTGAAAAPLVVKIADKYGNPIAGVTVTWAVSGGATLSAPTSTTDATGVAQEALTMGTAPGAYTITASALNLTPVSFTLTGQ